MVTASLPRSIALPGVLGLICTMSGCGGDLEATSPTKADAAVADAAVDAADSGATDASAPPPGTVSDSNWQDAPSTIHPDRSDCLDRPVGECERPHGLNRFLDEIAKCDPGGRSCGWLYYATDDNGCLSAINWPPHAPVSEEDRRVQRCLAEEMSRKRWPCDPVQTRNEVSLGSCTLAK